jgi:hypothetical protein
VQISSSTLQVDFSPFDTNGGILLITISVEFAGISLVGGTLVLTASITDLDSDNHTHTFQQDLRYSPPTASSPAPDTQSQFFPVSMPKGRVQITLKEADPGGVPVTASASILELSVG